MEYKILDLAVCAIKATMLYYIPKEDDNAKDYVSLFAYEEGNYVKMSKKAAVHNIRRFLGFAVRIRYIEERLWKAGFEVTPERIQISRSRLPDTYLNIAPYLDVCIMKNRLVKKFTGFILRPAMLTDAVVQETSFIWEHALRYTTHAVLRFLGYDDIEEFKSDMSGSLFRVPVQNSAVHVDGDKVALRQLPIDDIFSTLELRDEWGRMRKQEIELYERYVGELS